jgi:predicted ATPase
MTQSNSTTRRIVLTGAPSTGKTSVVARLHELGHPVLHEISRDIITQEGTKLGGEDPWRNLLAFSEVIWKLRSRQHHDAESFDGDVFFDRSLLDTLSYLQAGDKPIPEWMDAAPFPYHYKVFIFPPWEAIYRTDGERWEPFETAVRVHEALVSTYTSAGYELVEVPRKSVDERVEFILHVLQRA